MSETMIERVGMAIARHIHKDADYGLDGDAAFVSRRDDFLGIARAAIEAMREPTDAMAEFAEENFDRDSDDIKVCYRAFIHAALSQSTHPLPSEDR